MGKVRCANANTCGNDFCVHAQEHELSSEDGCHNSCCFTIHKSVACVAVKDTRPSWDEYFMEVCHAVAKRATCDRGKSGCVITRDNQILSTGYVGSPAGLPHCDDVGHQFKKTVHEDGHTSEHCVRTVHAEQNAICQAAKHGVPLAGATLYCSMTPCRVCAMLIINCGITRVRCDYHYHTETESIDMLNTAGVDISWIHEEEMEYGK